MAKYTRQEVIQDAKTLAKKLADTEEIEIFKEREAKINEQADVQRFMKRIKSLLEQADIFKTQGKDKALEKVEEEINRLQNEMDSIPEVQAFKESQTVVSDMLELISGTIARETTNEIIRSTGGDLLAGETGSKARNNQGGACCRA